MMRIHPLSPSGKGLPEIAVVVVGEANDDGFNASGLAGARAAADAGMARISIIDGLAYDEHAITESLLAAMADFDGLVFIGGQGDSVMPHVARAFGRKRFAIVQGESRLTNLACYDVAQEQSAFLAGCLAAWMTRTGTVGHLSGHRVRPGLKARAAFVEGVRHAAPEVAVLTSFCGSQDDNLVTRQWADAQIKAGADVMFTMLNGARAGAIDACRAGGIWQIGNALDWVALHPDVFLASALARIDRGVERAIADVATGNLPNESVSLGLAEGDYVGLSLGGDVPDDIAERLQPVVLALKSGDLRPGDDFGGSEFVPGMAAEARA
ncbi:BMP family ABC transporter substrate-binding protein [Labrenzia sp. OB1]|uniref:BMP family ABC transporter substrate-binding protein n=1 Tax=Labrenzia sp. OB1 TaxID=1561204 RepID=UPI000837FA3F|nr:BMP family ABC transporter substrate-binding protein [Labrenzia sp. OB1]